ncbi:glutamate dehydrogenase, partial [Lactiplantibacillus plantarum]
MSQATDYVQHVYQVIEHRDPNQTEFLEAINDVFKTITPVLEQHPEYIEANILERLTEPER